MSQLTVYEGIFLSSLIIISPHSNAKHDKISQHDAYEKENRAKFNS